MLYNRGKVNITKTSESMLLLFSDNTNDFIDYTKGMRDNISEPTRYLYSKSLRLTRSIILD